MRGRRPLPTAVRLLRNNPGKRAVNADEPQPGAPLSTEAPPTLTGEALAEWNRRAPQMSELGLLTDLDTSAFVAYCSAWGRYVAAEAKVAQQGEVLRSPSGYPIQNPHRALANKALQQCREFWTEFGMTPSARSRVHVPSANRKSKAEKFRDAAPRLRAVK